MAGAELIGHAEFFAGGGNVIHFVNFDYETALLHVLDPLPTAAASRTFVDVNFGERLCQDRSGTHKRYKEERTEMKFHNISICLSDAGSLIRGNQHEAD